MQPEYSTKPAVYYGWFIVGTLARPALLAERYGVAAYASISETLALALALAGALAPVGAGALRTGFGSYPPVFGLLALISFVAAGVVFIAMRAP